VVDTSNGGSSGGVSLSKGQGISLEKKGGGTLTAVRMGLGWQAAKRRGLFGMRTRDIDLDASAVLFAGKEPVDVVFFRHLVSDDGSVRHTGDNLVGGAGQGDDDESILVDLERVPERIDQIVFTVNSFTGQTFQEVRHAFVRLVDETTGEELARYTLDGGGQYTAQIMAKVHRSDGGWRMTALGNAANGRTFQDLMPSILPQL
jgi:tellurium resistance protein TerZ